jgi:hypothetical protein
MKTKEMLSEFSEDQHVSMGSLLADKDCFFLLFELWKAATPLKLVELCGKYRASSEIMVGILDQLLGLGCAAKASGGYSVTSFGRSVMAFVEAFTKEIGVKPTQAASPGTNILSFHQVLSDIPIANAGTNNSIRPALSARISMTSSLHREAKVGDRVVCRQAIHGCRCNTKLQ